jgi:hypothetical protein
MAEITKEALDYLVETGKKLSPVEKLEYDGRRYTRQEIKPVNEPTVSPLQISTLQSLIELLSGWPRSGDCGFVAPSPVVTLKGFLLLRKRQEP